MVFTGYMHYVVDYVKNKDIRFWAILNVLVFFLVWAIAEIAFRIWRMRHKMVFTVDSDANLKQSTAAEVDKAGGEG